MKNLYLLFFLFLCTLVRAQTTETFETETAGSTTFTDNGQVFNITSNGPNLFDIYSSPSGFGWNGTAIDNAFIDNSSSVSSNVDFSVYTAGGNLFNLKSMYLYIAQSSASLENVSGSVTITGSSGGATQFSVTSSSGFNTSLATANGFTYIDMSTYGGQNTASALIDKFTITSTGNIKYIALDAMTWQTAPSCIPPTVTSNPPNRAICSGSNTTFTFTATGATAYQWQVNTGAGFNNITNGGVYSGATTNTLTITGATAAMNGYQYRATAINGNSSCFTNSNNGTLTVSNINLSSAAQSNVSCNGGSNGAAGISPSGGISPYSYSWAPYGGSGAIATGLSAGNYTVTVTDNIGCTSQKNFTITQPLTPLTATTSKTDVSCNGGSNGTATVSVSGGTPSYSYSWSPSGGTNATATGLAAGTYTCTITDTNGCQITKTVTVNEPTTLTATTSKTDVSCNGGTNGTATVSVSGGTPSYTYSWAPSGGTNATASGLAAGTYTCTITDANSCQITKTVTVNQPTTLSLTPSSQTNISCNGGANGAASVNIATGGAGGYTYNWTPGNPTGDGTTSVTGLTAGTWTCTVTDTNSCTSSYNFTITQPTSALAVSPVSQTNVACNGGANGAASVTVSGGTAGYSYNWTPGNPTGDGTASVTGLSAGTWTCTVTDANSCTSSYNFTITQPPALAVSPVSQTNVACNGGANGAASVTVSGGTAGYSYNWTPGNPTGDGTASVTGLTAGTWTCTVTDANSCTSSYNFTITQPPALIASAIVDINESCDGNDGQATASATGGTAPYSYLWSNSATTATITGVMAGNYTVTITDNKGCTDTASVTILSNGITASAIVDANVSCNGGSNGAATASGSDGTAPYTYSWSNGANTASIAGVAAGTYTVTVTDANLCSNTANVTITEPSVLSANGAATNVSCNGGSNGTIDLTVTGGTAPYTYLWADNATTEDRTGLATGTYDVTVTDAKGCTKTASVTVTEPPVLTASGVAINVSCNGGSNGAVNLTVTGGNPPYTYAWSNTATTENITGLTAGTYNVTVTDAKGCTATASVTVTQPSVLTASGVATNVSCNGGSNGTVDLTVTGGTAPYSFLWSNTVITEDLTGLSAGTYDVTVTDTKGCTATASVTVTQPSVLTASISSLTNVACKGGTTGNATVSVTGGTSSYNYLWSNGATTATTTSLAAGNHSVTITDANGCTTTANVTITEPIAALSASGIATNVSCNGGSNGTIDLTVIGGTAPYTYLWADSATTEDRTGLAAGTYDVTVSDANSCTTTASVTVNEPSVLTASGVATNVSCNGGSNGTVDLTVTGGTAPYSFVWSNTATTEDLTGLAAGIYDVTVTDAKGCTATASVTVTQPSALSAFISSLTNVACKGGTTGTASVSVTGGTASYTYLWSSGATTATATGLAAGNHSVTITDANGCTTTVNVTLNEPTFALSAAISSQTNILCNGAATGNATVTADGGTTPYTYLWSSGATTATATGLVGGNHSVTITDTNGCTTTANVTITEPISLNLTILTSNVTCNGGSNGSATATVSGGVAPYSYSWSDSGVVGANPTNLVAGTYTLTVADNNGCTVNQTITIDEPDALSLSFSTDNVSCPGSSDGTATVVVSGGTAPYEYLWSNDTTTASLVGLTDGTYTVTITDDNGCTLIDSVTVITTPDITAPVADVTTLPTITVECSVPAGMITAPTATDNCVGTVTATTTDPLTYTAQGTYTITWTYNDGNGNASTQTQTVVVDDITAPVADISTLPTVTVECSVPAGMITAPIATDNCVGTVMATTTDPLTYTAQGTYTITWTYDDGNGNTTTQTQTVVVDDITAPVADVTTLPTITVECSVPAGMITAPTATDNCVGTVTATTTDPLTYTVQGTYTIIWTYNDGNGNASTQTQTVVVDDITAPVADVTTLPTVTVECSIPAGMITAPTATDNCVGTVMATTTDPLTYTAQGTYTITWTYNDGNGNTSTQTQTVVVDDITAPVTDVTTLPTVTVECSVPAGMITAPTATDNCVGTVTATTTDPLTYTAQGTYTITWTYNDGNGNTTTQTQTVVVDDITAPVADVTNLPEIINYCGVMSDEIPVPTATDNCAGVLNATTTDSLEYTSEGSYTITWTYDDGNGNTTTQTQTVTVEASPLDAVTFDDAGFVYNGTVQSIGVNNLPAGATVTYTISPETGNDNGAVNAGVYTVTAIVMPQPEGFNCAPVTLTATITIDQAPQTITFDPIPVKNLETDVDFQLDATASSGLEVYYTYTYTSPDPAADVSSTGWVTLLTSGEITITAHQDGNENFLPAEVVNQPLIIESSDASIFTMVVGDVTYDTPQSNIYHLIDCGDNSDSIVVTMVTETGATVQPGQTFTIQTPQPGNYTETVTVTSQDGTSTETYTITVERRFDFSDIVVQKFDNVLLVNNNPQNNGGYEFTAYEWYRNGQLVGTEQYYSAGNNLGDMLDADAEYMVKVTTAQGEVLQTCLGQIFLQHVNSARLYPNPVAFGQKLTIEADLPVAELEDMTIAIYTLNGALVKEVKSSSRITEIDAPMEEAVYIVMLKSANYSKTFKVIVR